MRKWFWLVVVPIVVVASVVVWWLMPRPVAGKSVAKSGVSRSQAVPKKRVARPAADVRFEGVDKAVAKVEKQLVGDRFQGVRGVAGERDLVSRVLVDDWDCVGAECVPTAYGVGVVDKQTYQREGVQLVNLHALMNVRLVDSRVWVSGGRRFVVGVVEAVLPSSGVQLVGFGGFIGVDELGEKVWFVDSDTFA